MKNYKILRIAGIHYFSAVESWLKENPEFENNSYDEMLKLFFNSGIMYSDGFSRSFRELGQDAHEIMADFEILQKQWARENGIQYDSDRWASEIIMAQVKAIKPDIIYFQGTEWSMPGRFFPERLNDNLIKILKEAYPFIKKVIIFSGYPSSINRLAGADFLFSASPNNLNYYKKQGIDTIMPSLINYHSFDDSISPKLNGTPGKYGFTFVGMSRAPESRYWALRQLLDQTALEAWVYELPLKIPQKTLKRQIRDALKWCFKFMDDQRVHTLVNSKLTPDKFSNIFMDILRERSYTEGQVISLKKMHPDQCHSPVVGIDMYNLLRQSKITFNKHADEAFGNVGNMRMFEATGVGTCLITDNGYNMRDLFEPDKEVVTYSSIDEAVEKVNYLLDHPDEAEQIAKAGQARTLRDHTIMNRCRQIDEVIQKIL